MRGPYDTRNLPLVRTVSSDDEDTKDQMYSNIKGHDLDRKSLTLFRRYAFLYKRTNFLGARSLGLAFRSLFDSLSNTNCTLLIKCFKSYSIYFLLLLWLFWTLFLVNGFEGYLEHSFGRK
jgi:hypothetical protein